MDESLGTLAITGSFARPKLVSVGPWSIWCNNYNNARNISSSSRGMNNLILPPTKISSSSSSSSSSTLRIYHEDTDVCGDITLPTSDNSLTHSTVTHLCGSLCRTNLVDCNSNDIPVSSSSSSSSVIIPTSSILIENKGEENNPNHRKAAVCLTSSSPSSSVIPYSSMENIPDISSNAVFVIQCGEEATYTLSTQYIATPSASASSGGSTTVSSTRNSSNTCNSNRIRISSLTRIPISNISNIIPLQSMDKEVFTTIHNNQRPIPNSTSNIPSNSPQSTVPGSYFLIIHSSTAVNNHPSSLPFLQSSNTPLTNMTANHEKSITLIGVYPSPLDNTDNNNIDTIPTATRSTIRMIVHPPPVVAIIGTVVFNTIELGYSGTLFHPKTAVAKCIPCFEASNDTVHIYLCLGQGTRIYSMQLQYTLGKESSKTNNSNCLPPHKVVRYGRNFSLTKANANYGDIRCLQWLPWTSVNTVMGNGSTLSDSITNPYVSSSSLYLIVSTDAKVSFAASLSSSFLGTTGSTVKMNDELFKPIKNTLLSRKHHDKDNSLPPTPPSSTIPHPSSLTPIFITPGLNQIHEESKEYDYSAFVRAHQLRSSTDEVDDSMENDGNTIDEEIPITLRTHHHGTNIVRTSNETELSVVPNASLHSGGFVKDGILGSLFSIAQRMEIQDHGNIQTVEKLMDASSSSKKGTDPTSTKLVKPSDLSDTLVSWTKPCSHIHIVRIIETKTTNSSLSDASIEIELLQSSPAKLGTKRVDTLEVSPRMIPTMFHDNDTHATVQCLVAVGSSNCSSNNSGRSSSNMSSSSDDGQIIPFHVRLYPDTGKVNIRSLPPLLTNASSIFSLQLQTIRNKDSNLLSSTAIMNNTEQIWTAGMVGNLFDSANKVSTEGIDTLPNTSVYLHGNSTNNVRVFNIFPILHPINIPPPEKEVEEKAENTKNTEIQKMKSTLSILDIEKLQSKGIEIGTGFWKQSSSRSIGSSSTGTTKDSTKNFDTLSSLYASIQKTVEEDLLFNQTQEKTSVLPKGAERGSLSSSTTGPKTMGLLSSSSSPNSPSVPPRTNGGTTTISSSSSTNLSKLFRAQALAAESLALLKASQALNIAIEVMDDVNATTLDSEGISLSAVAPSSESSFTSTNNTVNATTTTMLLENIQSITNHIFATVQKNT